MHSIFLNIDKWTSKKDKPISNEDFSKFIRIGSRTIRKKLLKLKGQFPALAILGPRQSGKTTLAKMLFPDHRYVNLVPSGKTGCKLA